MLDIADNAAYDIGEVNASLGYYQSAIEWYKLSRITPSVSYSLIYKSMADAYALSGDFDNYVHMLDRIALLNDAASSNYLGNAYFVRGNYQKAIEYDKMAIDYNLANNLKLGWLASLNNEASARFGLGDYASAQVLLDQIDAYMSDFDNMWVEITAPDLVRTVYGTKAVLFRKLGDRVGAYEAIARMEFSVMGVGADIQGFKPSAENVSTLSELGLWYSMQDVPVEAVVDRIESDKFILDNMKSLVKQSCEKYTPKEKAELYVGKVLAACESVPHPFFRAQLEMNAAYTMHNLGEYDKASVLFRKSFPMMLDYLTSQYSTMSENSRNNVFESGNLDNLLPLVASSECHASSGGDFGFLYDVNLFFKGFLLHLSDNFNDIIHKSSPELQEQFLTLKSLQQQIVADKANRPEEEVAIKEKEAMAEKLEMELVSKSKSFGSFVKDMRLTWRDVAASMGEKDLAVEFMDYPVDGGKDRRYIALLLRKNDTSPKMVQLCLESELTALTRGGVNTTYSPKGNSVALFNLIWAPLSQYMVSGENVFFAPSGELYKIAVESLYMPDGGLVSGRYNLHRISSTRIICKPQQTVHNASAVLYGGLKYDLNDKELSKASERTRGEDYVIDGIDNSRGLVLEKDGISVGKSWIYLPGTMKEVQDIGSVMKSKGLMVKSLSGSAGNEESFRMLSGNSPDILHIATHGFYSRRLAKGDDSPMSSSGLVLSGANLKWISGQVPDGVEDGLLFANEIARLDLGGTDLVVLSACDTGLGEISGEGVSGLQRGFKQAGVNTIMMTLSKVEDNATALMMKTFYTNLLSGRTRLDSFKAAQSAVRDAYQEPKYWAPFILLEN
jgi:CHAT domain-containing protein/tetratricopeptide (TPR) repeat protein